MQPHQIKADSRSSGPPELSFAKLVVNVTSGTKSIEVEVNGGKQTSLTVLKLRAAVVRPKEIEGRELAIRITQSTETTHAYVPKLDLSGIGMLGGSRGDEGVDELELRAVLLPDHAQEVFELIMQQQLSYRAPLMIKCEVLGLGNLSVWDPVEEPLLVQSLKFSRDLPIGPHG